MFTLHPTLDRDTFFLTRWALCRVLLMNNAALPWLILVPELPDLRELHDLDPSQQALLMTEITHLSRLLQTKVQPQPDKINVAALGNLVPQLHIHVIARYRQDPAWPQPVWGNLPANPYDAEGLPEILDEWRRLAACRIC